MSYMYTVITALEMHGSCLSTFKQPTRPACSKWLEAGQRQQPAGVS